MADRAGPELDTTAPAPPPWLYDAEQVEQKYEEALAGAVEACASDTAGQTCYICFAEGDAEEGLVRGCACRGEGFFAHVSCLAKAAQVAVASAAARR